MQIDNDRGAIAEVSPVQVGLLQTMETDICLASQSCADGDVIDKVWLA